MFLHITKVSAQNPVHVTSSMARKIGYLYRHNPRFNTLAYEIMRTNSIRKVDVTLRTLENNLALATKPTKIWQMIDSVKIILKNFSGNLEKCCISARRQKLILSPDEREYDNYRLPNHTRFDKHYLKVSHARKTGTVTVIGSIRKRAYHNASLLDLNKAKFEQTIRQLARDLDVPFEEIKNARFTDCEIGANINIRHSAKEVLQMVVAYSNLKRNDERIDEGTLYFDGADKDLKLYAKDIEIAAKSHWKKREGRSAAFARMRACGNHMLRIEFTLKYQRSFNHHRMEHIKTVGDLIEHYHELYEFWTRELARLIFFNRLDYKDAQPTENETTIIQGLEQYGFEWIVAEYQKQCTANATTANSIKTARSKAYQSVCKVLDQYYDRKSYNLYTLRADIVKFLLRKSKSDELNLPLLLRNLWGVPTSLSNNKFKK